ncbi:MULTISPECIES: YvrJ family protein [Clostridium]|uniref:YvrJ family protein n=1 Tax=Clostridium butyricum TaxID=1492 RepID=A0AAP9REJ5_CLOBU|nr:MULTISPECIES: YvrJ family protein [Clostridium]ALP90560.1 hypothetical protein ATN24_10560 [Clostridium butyricum]ALS17063.1 hypothetical protein ATD26_09365 [Clostridium butyricum]ANF14179.1 hypothetical protein AZ909_09010 [Clostridium butyricum]AOR94245.1 hypothetical protein BBB49_09190 [Clostridium butyricum]MBS5981404.1 YvrJ family protein [Clostridium butyricum]
MDINELVSLIGNVGFPVAVSTYLLVRLEKQIQSLTTSITRLNTIISARLGVLIDSSCETEQK